MGAYFGSIQVRCEDRDSVKAAVEIVAQECKRKFLIGPPLNGWIAVYPDDSGQDEKCAVALAKRLNNVLLQLIVHHDDIFAYNLFRNGQLLNRYSSDPDAFGEVSAAEREQLKPQPELFHELVDSPAKLDKLPQLLDPTEKVIFEQHRLEQFARLLGIQNTLTSYKYLVDGEREGIRGWKEFIHVPDQTDEKAAKKEADAALRREKLEWQRKGLLCGEWLPPCRGRDATFWLPDFCADAIHGGFVVLWRRMVGLGNPPQLQHLRPPWPSKPELIDIVFSSSNPDSLTISPTGNWLAFVDDGLRLWDWCQRRWINDIRLDAKPVAFTPDETRLLCQSVKTTANEKLMRTRVERRLFMISLETRQVVQTIHQEDDTIGVMALHPSNSFLVTRHRQDQLGIVNLDSGKLENVLFSGTITDWSHLAPPFAQTLKQAGLGEHELAEWKKSFVRASDEILNMKFSPDGSLLLCATTAGLRVHAWNDLLAATNATPKPLFAVTPRPEASSLNQEHYANYIYDVTMDAAQNRLLFCGIQGVLRFLNLSDGKTGILLDPPGKSPIWRLGLSHDRKFICCLCFPPTEDRHRKPPRLQVWNYEALCKTTGPD